MTSYDINEPNFRREDACVQDTTLMSDILDDSGRVRFRASMTDMWDLVEVHDPNGNRYRVEIIDVCDPTMQRQVADEWYRWREDAVSHYREYVQKYKILASGRPECFDMRGPRANYRPVEPDCCARCMWCQRIVSPCGRHVEYICRNPKMSGPVRPDRPHPDVGFYPPLEPCKTGGHDWEAPTQRKPLKHWDSYEQCWIPGPARRELRCRHFPRVDARWICDMFENGLPEMYRDPRHSERTWREHDCADENRFDAIAKFEARRAANEDVGLITANGFPGPERVKTRFEHRVDKEVEKFVRENPPDLITGDNDGMADGISASPLDELVDDRLKEEPPEVIYIGGGATR